jgi:predicted acetyltransferase
MPKLMTPHVRFHTSFVAAMAEFQAEGRGGAGDDSVVGGDIRAFGSSWQEPEVFAWYVEGLCAESREGTPRPQGYVACTTLWYAEDDTYLGRLAIRHSLTPALLANGGHIGYDVRATARRRGHATAMLRASLPIARDLGIDSALITCTPDNVGSRRVIESCGGVLEDVRDGQMRYWVPTTA